ncbi:MAG: sigma-54-dependent Fis family transcriptional regulator [Calditrichaeota bacterium]|nr:sigma-54-dependent Fis family transcriptional regulator [Calditrichota bacterium]
MSKNILIVDDDDITRESLNAILSNSGFVCDQSSNGAEALEKLSQREFDVVITDLEMPGMNGIELLEKAGQLCSGASFIIITAYASVETAIEALRKGAFDYMLKPINFQDVAIKVQKLMEHKELVTENQALRQEVNAQYDFSNIVGQSTAIRDVFETIRQVANSESNVLITGNSGTGKELVAKAIHFNSPQQRGRFMAVNCGAITETLFESEIFGHKRGSFTGAISDKDGLFKVAHNGTLFLDEIGEMSMAAQAKLLRAIDTQEILPVGATTPIKVHVRIIAATNSNLQKNTEEGTFREDLFYRLNVIEIHLPSLRERPEDIPLLIHHFIAKYNRQMNKNVTSVEPLLMSALVAREWKGEVRELENFIERLMIFAKKEKLTMEDLPPNLSAPMKPSVIASETAHLKTAVENFEREFIKSQLAKNDFHRGKTARALGIGEATLYRKMSQLGIDA